MPVLEPGGGRMPAVQPVLKGNPIGQHGAKKRVETIECTMIIRPYCLHLFVKPLVLQLLVLASQRRGFMPENARAVRPLGNYQQDYREQGEQTEVA